MPQAYECFTDVRQLIQRQAEKASPWEKADYWIQVAGARNRGKNVKVNIVSVKQDITVSSVCFQVFSQSSSQLSACSHASSAAKNFFTITD
jgi:hypothetical protein